MLDNYCKEQGIFSIPMMFTHDAEDSLTNVNSLFVYINAMLYKMQDDVYEKMGMPMRIDFEVGVDNYHMCGISDIEKEDNGNYSFELEGEDIAVDLLIEKINQYSKWLVVENELIESKEKYTSFDEMFSTKSAYKSGNKGWGNTHISVSRRVKLTEKLLQEVTCNPS